MMLILLCRQHALFMRVCEHIGLKGAWMVRAGVACFEYFGTPVIFCYQAACA